MKIPKTVRNTAITAVILAVLFIGAATAYVLVTDGSGNKPATSSASSYQPPSLPKPSKPSPQAVEGAAVEAVDSPVAAGSNTSISIKTNAGSTCTITVTYNGVASKDSGLGPKLADDYGNVTWTWTVGSTVPAGTWPIKVLCTYTNGKSAMVESEIQVTK